MMKAFFYSLLACLLFTLPGCSFDPRYEAEKAYWEARKLDRTLHQENPDGLEEEHYDQIIAALNQVSDIAPFEPIAAQAQFQIAQIYLDLEKREEAHETLKETFFKFTHSENKNKSTSKDIAAQAKFWSGRLYEAKGEIEKAQEEYAILMEQYPLTSRGLQTPVYIVQYYKNQGDLQKIKEACARAHAYYQELMEKYAGTSIEEQIKRYSLQVFAQEEAWQDILDFWDSESKTRIARSEVLYARVAKADLLASRMENLPEAEAIYKDIIENFPVDPITPLVRIRLGYLLSARYKIEEARETFQAILDDFPENKELTIQSRIGLAAVDAREGNYEEALQGNIDLFAEYPNHATTLKVPFMKYLYYRRADREDDEVAQALEEAISEYSSRWNKGGSGNTDKVAGRLLFSCLIQKKDWDAAVGHLNSLIRRFPSDPRFLQLSKAIYREDSSNPAKALQIVFDPSGASTLFQSEDVPLQDVEKTFQNPQEQP